MRSPSAAARIALLVTATAALLLSTTMAWATANDFGVRGRVPEGVSVVGTPLAGLDRSQVREALKNAVAAPLLRPVIVEAAGSSFTFDPRGAVQVDVEGMADEALSARASAPYLMRLLHDVADRPIRFDVEPRYSIDESSVAAWLADVASDTDRRSRNASVTVVESAVRIRPSVTGRRLDRAAASELLMRELASPEALGDRPRRLAVPVKDIRPKVTEDRIGKTIVVDLSERRVRLFDGAKLEKAYPCAIGTPSYPTPTGVFTITLKRYLPTWVNPAPNGWGKDMPASIGPGPTNPLGTRALNLSAPGIRFHGTTNLGSIGTAASHGCMRMRRSDIEDLYERVKVGTKVHIIP